MNDFIEQQKCYITTLSPVHMGCGEDYYPTQYVIDDGLMYVFDELQMAKVLGSAMMNDLAKLADTEKDVVAALQRKIHVHKEKLKLIAEHVLPVSTGIQVMYNRIIKNEIKEQNKKDQNKFQFERTFYNPFDNNPIITGSGIKGAIRTALLDQLNNGLERPDFKGDKFRGPPKGVFEKLQKQLLEYHKIDEDPFRLLKISDSAYEDKGTLPTEIMFSVRHKREPKGADDRQGVYAMLECISPWRHHAFSFHISIIECGLIEKRMKKNNCLPQSIDDLVECCNRFYKKRLDNELLNLAKYRYTSIDCNEAAWSISLQKLLAGELGHAINNNRVMLLRLGKHGGAEDKTIDGVRNIRIKLKQGSEFRSKTTEIALASNSEKSKTNLMPFGWVLVEIGQQSLPETMKFIAEMAKPAFAFKERETNRLIERKKILEEIEIENARRDAEKAEMEKQRLAEEHEKAERAAMLAAMSPEQVVLEKLNEKWKAEKAINRKQAGGDLDNMVGDCIKNAVEWSLEDRQKLYEKCKEILVWLGKDKKKMKEKLAALNVVVM